MHLFGKYIITFTHDANEGPVFWLSDENRMIKRWPEYRPTLIGILKNEDTDVRQDVAEALRQIGTPKAVAAVHEYEKIASS